ncbi:MAG TPA: fluoride efflux transporter CrcB [Vicinamibacterales bacterium]|nr:fluoride efflux transporter CrcB [Vicinamibacterales bacterium]
MTWILVGVGGALGSMARHGLNQLINVRVVGGFPSGIFVINVLGSVLIGLVAGAIASTRWTPSADTRIFVVVGLLGGFTTFSSFSLDTLTLVRAGSYGQAAWNTIGQVGLSLLGAMIGFKIATS